MFVRHGGGVAVGRFGTAAAHRFTFHHIRNTRGLEEMTLFLSIWLLHRFFVVVRLSEGKCALPS